MGRHPQPDPPEVAASDDASTLAAIIAGDRHPPIWLYTVCSRAIELVKWCVERDRGIPTREVHRDRLTALGNAAALIIAEMNDPAIFLMIGKAGAARDNLGAERTDVLIEECGWLHTLATDARDSIRIGKGADKALDLESPQLVNALCIDLIWFGVREEPIPITCESALLACSVAWRAAGGVAGHSGRGWSRHLASVRDEKYHQQWPQMLGFVQDEFQRVRLEAASQ